MGYFKASSTSDVAANHSPDRSSHSSRLATHLGSGPDVHDSLAIEDFSVDSGYAGSGDTNVPDRTESSGRSSSQGSHHSSPPDSELGELLFGLDYQFLDFYSACQAWRSDQNDDSSDWDLESSDKFPTEPSLEFETNMLSFHDSLAYQNNLLSMELLPRMHAFYGRQLNTFELTLARTVSWNWNGSHPSGTAAEIKPGDVTVTSHRGNDITKTGTKQDPAVHSEYSNFLHFATGLGTRQWLNVP